MNEYIIVNGAKGNNLKDISVRIPKNKLVAITGLSGSGKSTLAFERLICMLKRMVEQENSVVVIEHNVDFIRTSDWVIDMGPGGGLNGGKVIAQGPPATIKKSDDPITGTFL